MSSAECLAGSLQSRENFVVRFILSFYPPAQSASSPPAGDTHACFESNPPSPPWGLHSDSAALHDAYMFTGPLLPSFVRAPTLVPLSAATTSHTPVELSCAR